MEQLKFDGMPIAETAVRMTGRIAGLEEPIVVGQMLRLELDVQVVGVQHSLNREGLLRRVGKLV